MCASEAQNELDHRQGADKIRVIIADDHLLFREGTRRLIEAEHDIEVVGEASDGEEAVELVNRLRPHVALVDIAMPKMNGIDATRKIKSSHSPTAVLILTAYDNEQYVMALFEAGAAGYLLKNVSGRDLMNAIRSVHGGESVLHPSVAQRIFQRLVSKDKRTVELNSFGQLSEREMQVLRLAARGLSNQEIGDRLFLSRRTVQAHLGSVFRKMDIGSRTEAILQALKKGWITLDDVG